MATSSSGDVFNLEEAKKCVSNICNQHSSLRMATKLFLRGGFRCCTRHKKWPHIHVFYWVSIELVQISNPFVIIQLVRFPEIHTKRINFIHCKTWGKWRLICDGNIFGSQLSDNQFLMLTEVLIESCICILCWNRWCYTKQFFNATFRCANVFQGFELS